MTLQQLKDEAMRIYIYHLQEDTPLFTPDILDSLITKAYKEGKKDNDSEPIEEIPQMKGTLEALDKLTPPPIIK